jgi:hypothetical protein
MALGEIGCGGMVWSRLAQAWDNWRAFVKAVTKCWEMAAQLTVSWVVLSSIELMTYVESRTRTECSHWSRRARRCSGQNEELEVVTRTDRSCSPWEARRCSGRNEELDVVTRTRTDRSCSPWRRRRYTEQNEELDCLYRAVSGSVRPGGRDANVPVVSRLEQ